MVFNENSTSGASWVDLDQGKLDGVPQKDDTRLYSKLLSPVAFLYFLLILNFEDSASAASVLVSREGGFIAKPTAILFTNPELPSQLSSHPVELEAVTGCRDGKLDLENSGSQESKDALLEAEVPEQPLVEPKLCQNPTSASDEHSTAADLLLLPVGEVDVEANVVSKSEDDKDVVKKQSFTALMMASPEEHNSEVGAVSIDDEDEKTSSGAAGVVALLRSSARKAKEQSFADVVLAPSEEDVSSGINALTTVEEKHSTDAGVSSLLAEAGAGQEQSALDMQVAPQKINSRLNAVVADAEDEKLSTDAEDLLHLPSATRGEVNYPTAKATMQAALDKEVNFSKPALTVDEDAEKQSALDAKLITPVKPTCSSEIVPISNENVKNPITLFQNLPMV